ncbi:MAG: hypothetical protein ACK42C_08175 [Aquificaceae bacterium]|jgi:hypothetical protein|uniref:hypothetical protein n=1 Tax=Hydrogenobacter sp. Uz 6-8 TaxID=3384828 RepID=UPI000F1E74D7|nr:MAG: hypothetical protein D6804_05365 [Aquificota bacterium]
MEKVTFRNNSAYVDLQKIPIAALCAYSSLGHSKLKYFAEINLGNLNRCVPLRKFVIELLKRSGNKVSSFTTQDACMVAAQLGIRVKKV